MGVNTIAILRKGITADQIQKALSGKYDDVEIKSTSGITKTGILWRRG